MIEHGDEHARYAVQSRTPLCLDTFQYRSRIESGAWVHCLGAVRKAVQVSHHHAKTMIERHRYADGVLSRDPHGLSDLKPVVQDIEVRQGDRLRRACGAAGELDIHGIVRADISRNLMSPDDVLRQDS